MPAPMIVVERCERGHVRTQLARGVISFPKGSKKTAYNKAPQKGCRGTHGASTRVGINTAADGDKVGSKSHQQTK